MHLIDHYLPTVYAYDDPKRRMQVHAPSIATRVALAALLTSAVSYGIYRSKGTRLIALLLPIGAGFTVYKTSLNDAKYKQRERALDLSVKGLQSESEKIPSDVLTFLLQDPWTRSVLPWRLDTVTTNNVKNRPLWIRLWKQICQTPAFAEKLDSSYELILYPDHILDNILDNCPSFYIELFKSDSYQTLFNTFKKHTQFSLKDAVEALIQATDIPTSACENLWKLILNESYCESVNTPMLTSFIQYIRRLEPKLTKPFILPAIQHGKRQIVDDLLTDVIDWVDEVSFAQRDAITKLEGFAYECWIHADIGIRTSLSRFGFDPNGTNEQGEDALQTLCKNVTNPSTDQTFYHVQDLLRAGATRLREAYAVCNDPRIAGLLLATIFLKGGELPALKNKETLEHMVTSYRHSDVKQVQAFYNFVLEQAKKFETPLNDECQTFMKEVALFIQYQTDPGKNDNNT